jgi:LPXTG-site transpeptidase (sortase) family protein
VLLIVSIVVIVVGLVALILPQWQARQEAEVATVGSRDLVSIAAQEPSALPMPAPSFATPSASSLPTDTASATPTVAPVPAMPVHVRIPAIDVSTQVLPVGLDEARAVAIPEDITKVGWYELGVAPGSDVGSAVLVAHRDGRVQGHGVFYDLGQLGVGDKVIVTTDAGDTLAYRVLSRELIAKKGLPLEELFAIDGPARLTLISCGGYYDRNNGGYQDNVVVTAVPIDPVTS